MGVKLLNKFLRIKCKDESSVKKVHLSQLHKKKIAIDTSIYLYRYKGENILYEGFYNMCSTFIQYGVQPIFVFDGKPPKEKEEELKRRSSDKAKAEKEFHELKEQLSTVTTEQEAEEIEQNMDLLRKQFIRLKTYEVQKVKNIIAAFGLSFVTATGESDQLCAAFALHKKVYAVMSEDMDMFVYGCPNIIRYFSLTKHTCIVYKYKNIITELGMTKEHFRDMCIISGTDYNKYKKKDHMNIFNYYKKYFLFTKSGFDTMYEYFKNITLITQDDVEELQYIRSLFNICNNDTLDMIIKNVMIKNTQVNVNNIEHEMKTDNFIFV